MKAIIHRFNLRQWPFLTKREISTSRETLAIAHQSTHVTLASRDTFLIVFFGFIFCFVAFTLIFFLRFCIRKQIRNNRRLNGNKAVGVLLSKSLFIPNTEVKTQKDLHRSKGPTALINFRVIWVIRFSTRSIQVDPRLARESHDIVKKTHTHTVHQLVCDLNPLLRLGYFSLYFANKKYFIIFNPRV